MNNEMSRVQRLGANTISSHVAMHHNARGGVNVQLTQNTLHWINATNPNTLIQAKRVQKKKCPVLISSQKIGPVQVWDSDVVEIVFSIEKLFLWGILGHFSWKQGPGTGAHGWSQPIGCL